jgi:hypothetical protein
VEAILGAAGFAEPAVADVRQPSCYGLEVAAALEWVGGCSSTRELLLRLGAAAAERALERLGEALAAQASEPGVWFDARTWSIEACRR